jgi:hypothetical protein
LEIAQAKVCGALPIITSRLFTNLPYIIAREAAPDGTASLSNSNGLENYLLFLQPQWRYFVAQS